MRHINETHVDIFHQEMGPNDMAPNHETWNDPLSSFEDTHQDGSCHYGTLEPNANIHELPATHLTSCVAHLHICFATSQCCFETNHQTCDETR